MNPFPKMTKEVRSIKDVDIISTEKSENEFYVEGYASTYVPTVLFEYDGIEYKEKIDRNAFNNIDLTDVIFNYNHGGKVLARTKNKTLYLHIDEKGLFVRARLDGTEEGRKMYQEIKGGYIDKMSISFAVEEDSYNNSTNTRTILKLKRLYDVSAVDIPAYDTTLIYARNNANLEDIKTRIKDEKDLQFRKLEGCIKITNLLYGGL